MIKLADTWASYSTYELAVDLMGADGMLIDNYDMVRPAIMGGSSLGGESEGPPNPQKAWLTSLGGTIGGGTSAIVKNVLGERVLGLPGDVRVPEGLPWSRGAAAQHRTAAETWVRRWLRASEPHGEDAGVDRRGRRRRLATQRARGLAVIRCTRA